MNNKPAPLDPSNSRPAGPHQPMVNVYAGKAGQIGNIENAIAGLSISTGPGPKVNACHGTTAQVGNNVPL
jgi:hypothetical protein